jgi:AcrR family transcriptional regulator
MADAAQTRAHILQVATKEFARNGFSETSANDIATASGLSTGMIYYYFDSKAGVYAAVSEAAAERLNEGFVTDVGKRTAHVPDLRGRLQVLIDALEECVESDLDIARLSFGADVEASRSEVVAASQREFATILDKLFNTILRSAPDDALTPEQAEQRALIEVIALGFWQFLVRPGGFERLPAAIEAFREALDGGLLDPPAADLAR